MDIQHVLNTAQAISLEAGEILSNGFQSEKKIEFKSSTIDLVTNFDQTAEELIRGRLKSAFPDHLIVGEEQGADEGESEHVWYVDPIDGTTNFAHGIPIFCVSMAMYTDNKPMVGVVYDPMQDELYYASADNGAYLIRKGSTPQKLQVTSVDQLEQALLGTGFAYDRYTSELDNLAQVGKVVKQCRGLRRLGSAALDLAYVAAGRLDGFWEFKLNSYDVAAGILLVQEAGGKVCSLADGGPITLSEAVHILASGPNLEQILLDTLRP